jgi:hypothetical protein
MPAENLAAPAFIYALVDPRTNAIRYVGKANDPHVRLEDHVGLEGGNAAKHAWIVELLDAGVRPEARILEVVRDGRWGEREAYWIKRCREDGVDLLNANAGSPRAHTRVLSAVEREMLRASFALLVLSGHLLFRGGSHAPIVDDGQQWLPIDVAAEFLEVDARSLAARSERGGWFVRSIGSVRVVNVSAVIEAALGGRDAFGEVARRVWLDSSSAASLFRHVLSGTEPGHGDFDAVRARLAATIDEAVGKAKALIDDARRGGDLIGPAVGGEN